MDSEGDTGNQSYVSPVRWNVPQCLMHVPPPKQQNRSQQQYNYDSYSVLLSSKEGEIAHSIKKGYADAWQKATFHRLATPSQIQLVKLATNSILGRFLL